MAILLCLRVEGWLPALFPVAAGGVEDGDWGRWRCRKLV